MKEEILEGLRSSLARGQSLEKASASFYNAGYSKTDVDDAVQALKTPQTQQSYSYPTSQPLQQQQENQQMQQKQIQSSDLNQIQQNNLKQNQSAQSYPSQQIQSSQQEYIPQEIQKPQPVFQPLKLPFHPQFTSPQTQQVSQTIPQSFQPQPPGIPQENLYHQAPQPIQPFQSAQNISNYSGKRMQFSSAITFFLVFILLFLLGILAFMFLFRDQLSEFLAGFF